MNKFIFLILSVFVFCNCSSDDYDPIKLSEKYINCEYTKGTYNITTEGEEWWIQKFVVIDNKHIAVTEFETAYEDDTPEAPPVKITGDWFSITKEGKNKLVISLEENLANNIRELKVLLQNDNYLDELKIMQNKKQ